jgi:hypothetical protein
MLRTERVQTPSSADEFSRSIALSVVDTSGSSHILAACATSMGTARVGTGWHLRGNIGATSSTETDRDQAIVIRPKALLLRLDRDRPRYPGPSLDPRVEGSNPSRPIPLSRPATLCGPARLASQSRLTPLTARSSTSPCVHTVLSGLARPTAPRESGRRRFESFTAYLLREKSAGCAG